MKIYNLFLIFILITIIYSDDETACLTVANPKSKGDCNGKLSKIEKEQKYAYCCYASYSKKSELNHCMPVEQNLYDNMSKYMKYLKKTEEASEIYYEIYPDKKKSKEDYGDYSIDCNSNYLNFGIIILILFLI